MAFVSYLPTVRQSRIFPVVIKLRPSTRLSTTNFEDDIDKSWRMQNMVFQDRPLSIQQSRKGSWATGYSAGGQLFREDRYRYGITIAFTLSAMGEILVKYHDRGWLALHMLPYYFWRDRSREKPRPMGMSASGAAFKQEKTQHSRRLPDMAFQIHSSK